MLRSRLQHSYSDSGQSGTGTDAEKQLQFPRAAGKERDQHSSSSNHRKVFVGRSVLDQALYCREGLRVEHCAAVALLDAFGRFRVLEQAGIDGHGRVEQHLSAYIPSVQRVGGTGELNDGSGFRRDIVSSGRVVD
jgi:hypothetical protein